MTEKEWDKFFELLDKIVSLKFSTWQEKANQVKSQAIARDGEVDLEEFVGWFES